MSSVLRFSEANPVRMVITSWIGRNPLDREYMFFREYSEPGFDSFFQPFNKADSLSIQFDSSFDQVNTCKLKNYMTDAEIESASATEITDRTDYKVFQHTFTISGLAEGLYYIEVTGSDTDTETFTARSEPISIKASHCNTSILKYYNNEPAFGIDYRSGVTFWMRIPAIFNKQADTQEVTPFVDSGGNRSKINHIITKARALKATGLIPQWLIEKVNTAMAHDFCSINDVQVESENAWPYEPISNNKLWSEPEAVITLASGSSGYRNLHDDNTRETL